VKLRFTRRATRDIEGIAEEAQAYGPETANRIKRAIEGTLDMLTMFPHIGHRQSAAGVRKIVTTNYRYVIYYEVDVAGDWIDIIAVQHPAQRRPFIDA
jgi:toxin ParE1/3/4